MERLKGSTFIVAAFVVVGLGAGAGVAFAQDGQEAHDHETPTPPPAGSEAIDPDEARSFAPPAGHEQLTESEEKYTFDAAVDLATQLDAQQPAPDGTTFFYGMTPDGTFGVTGECTEGELSPEVAESLRSSGVDDLSVVQSLNCRPYFAESSDK